MKSESFLTRMWSFLNAPTLTQRVALVSTVLSTVALAAAYASGELWAGALAVLLLGMCWWIFGQEERWISSLALVGFVVAMIGGAMMGLGAGWMVVSLVLALSAWDLNHFYYRLDFASRVDDQAAVEREHIRRLLIVNGLGLLLASLALWIEIQLGFLVAIVLGGVAILGLSRMIAFLRDKSD